MRILIATVKIPFIRGGAEILADGLLDALLKAGHEAEIVPMPFKWYPPERILDHMLACRMLDLTESTGTKVDLVIGLKFPAYYVHHTNKVVWLLHQHRQAYELWDHPVAGDMIHFPNGRQVREAIEQADRNLLPAAKTIFTLSHNVSGRLKRYSGIDSKPLYHPPPGAESIYSGPAEDYLFCPSRITPIKRQFLVLEAVAHTRNPVRVRFAGAADTPPYIEQLKARARELRVSDRIDWLGRVNDAEKLRLYAHCLAVVYPPIDEDYGYVTLEAMLAAKPVITCSDSGGTHEFIVPDQTGLIVDADPAKIGAAMDSVWENRGRAAEMGACAREHYADLNISWETVVQELTR